MTTKEATDGIMEHLSKIDSVLAVQIEIMKRVENKVDKTNGRVACLETWKAWMIGFGACMTILVLPIAFIVLKDVL